MNESTRTALAEVNATINDVKSYIYESEDSNVTLIEATDPAGKPAMLVIYGEDQDGEDGESEILTGAVPLLEEITGWKDRADIDNLFEADMYFMQGKTEDGTYAVIGVAPDMFGIMYVAGFPVPVTGSRYDSANISMVFTDELGQEHQLALAAGEIEEDQA